MSEWCGWPVVDEQTSWESAQQILSDRAGMLEVIERSQLKAPDTRATLDSSMVHCRRL